MTQKLRTTLFAGAIAALVAGPIWATTDTAKDGAYTPATGQTESGQSDRSQSTTTQPMNQTPGVDGAAYVGTTARTSTGDNPLYTRSADDLKGVEVVDRDGDKVGDVKQIVLAPDRKSAHAVISSGGILGMGATDIMISLNDLTPIGDKLQMSATKSEATAQTDGAQDADQYVAVTGDSPISGSIVEFSAFDQETDANEAGTASTTPEVGADSPATDRETPRVPQ